MRYFIELAYNGASYCGWQRQPNALGVQQVIEDALSTILRCPTPIVGAGRTDAGVHAARMFAHFDADGLPSTLLKSLNHICGKYIYIKRIIPVSEDAHARFDATSRTYKYFISKEKSPFSYLYSWHPSCELNYEDMNQAASLLTDIKDFTSFAKLHSDAKTNICKVTHAEWKEEGAMHVFTITADRFLRNMVRAIVGTLVEVGRGKMGIDRFQQVIQSKNRCAAGTSMPGNALFLWDITYPYIKSVNTIGDVMNTCL